MPTHLTDTERIAVELQAFLETIEELALGGSVTPRELLHRAAAVRRRLDETVPLQSLQAFEAIFRESEAFALLLEESAPSFEPPVKRLRPLEPPGSREVD